uniref:FAD-binding protein n=1 Tax=Muribaculaceae bacterium Z82 TaxID=2304548 RepID=A0A7C9NAT7_9BACT
MRMTHQENKGKRAAGLSRRQVLSGGALLGLGAAATGLFGCSTPTPASDSGNDAAVTASAETQPVVAWDYETDVVVVGSGTGMAGAVAAASEGASVIVVEKRPMNGGSLAFSGGYAWTVNNKFSREHGDSEELGRTYLKKMQRGEGDDELSEAFLQNGNAMLEMLETYCNIEWQPKEALDYHPEWEGGMKGFRGCDVKARDGEDSSSSAGGGRLASRLLEGAEALGVEMMYSTAAKELVTQNNADGVREVVGIVADQNGKTVRIKANKGVILAAGGFEWDDELKANFIGGPAEFRRSVPENTGDALRMCMRVGADLRMMNACWGNVVYREDSQRLNDQGTPVGTALLMDRSKPFTIMVDNSGKRFCNEAADYDTLWWAFLNRETWGDTNLLGTGAWLIADDKMVQKWGLCTSTPYGTPGNVPEDAVIGESLEDLAAKINIPADQLVATVERFNEYADAGYDPEFHRGESAFYQGVDMDKIGTPEMTLGRLDTAPYYAIEVATACTGTHGGPRVNGNAQVIDVDGNPIPRLYAGGNTAGVGAPGMAYGGPGGTIGPGMVFNMLGGKHAASLDPVA